MRSRRMFQRSLVGILCFLGLLTAAPQARAGEFTLASCKSDLLNLSTQAFDGYYTRGYMRTRRACKQKGGDGLRALVLANIVRAGRVPRRALAEFVMDAPPGTQFGTFTWGGAPHLEDCRYRAEIWAETSDQKRKVSISPAKDADQSCRHRTAHAAEAPSTKDITGTTRIIAKLQCVATKQRPWCSARRSNYLKISYTEAVIVDQIPPTVAITPDTPLALGQWVGGQQPLNYDANDNVGIRSASAAVGGRAAGVHIRACAVAANAPATFDAKSPCPNGPGQISVDTTHLLEGTQPLTVTASDSAGNSASTGVVTARIDNTSPGRVDVAVQGGDAWRSTNDFVAAWSNPAEPDRAPIVSASYKLCPVGAGTCLTGQQVGNGISSLPISVPAPGEWKLSLWREDAAGNQTETAASVPVAFRYDPDPPQLGFESPSASDPTLIAVDVTDKVSGVATGAIEISQSGSGVWQELPTEMQGSRMTARIDDAALPAGSYVLRARATDQANNEASTQTRLDGQPMALTLPLRTVTAMQAGFQIVRTVTQIRRRHGKRVRIRRHVTVTHPTARIEPGKVVEVTGRLTNPAGQGIAGQQITVFSASSVSPEQPVGIVQTDGDGDYTYAAAGSSSRTLRFAFAGSPVLLPTQTSVTMSVPALISLKVNRRRLRNGQTVTFSGGLHTLPAPPGGKLLELQVRLPKGWETFRTLRTDPAGRWSARYHFTRTYGVQHYRFRARLPEESGYPFAEGGSRAVTVEVRGRR